MATISKRAPKTRKPPKSGKTSPKAYEEYVRLRTLLDSLEIGALRYYLDGTTDPEKKQRLKELEARLLPIIRYLWGEGLITCPRGYTDCDGVCVPYSCLG